MAGILIVLFGLIFLQTGNDEYRHFEAGAESCIECHSDLTENTVVHPQLESICDICHTPTGAVHPSGDSAGFVLSERLPDLCFVCHDDFSSQVESDISVHGPLTDSLSCINCHNPHSSSQNSLLINGSNDLCFYCHDRTIKNDSTTVRNIKQVILHAKSIHPVAEAGGCVTCHNPHFGENPRMLIGGYIRDQYARSETSNFELCFFCHDTDLMEAERTEFGTNFRNGEENLHFIHLQGEKGRNCSMCHDPHGAANEKLIIDKLQFGNWVMDITFEATENGGSCLTACHSKKIYDRDIQAGK